MADIRINALATTAASTASDDFIAVDGSANGTRKLNAYSPTFGGNLTVSGNAAIGTDVFKIDSTNTRILFGLAAALQGDTVEIAAKSNAGAISLFGRASNNQSVISFRQNGSTTQKAFVQGGDTGLELGSGSSIGLTINSSNNTSLAGNLTVSGTGTSSVAGSLSVNTAAGGNPTVTSTLQLTSPAVTETGAGGLEFKADVSNNGYGFRTLPVFNGVSSYDLYTQSRSNSASWTTRMSLTNTGNLLIGTTTDNGAKFQVEGYATFNRNGADGYLSVSRTSGATGTFGAGSSNAYLGTASNHPLVLYTNNTTALTLDSSQRCILAGALRLNNAYTAGAPTATGYVTLQDSAGNTYKVLVGT